MVVKREEVVGWVTRRQSALGVAFPMIYATFSEEVSSPEGRRVKDATPSLFAKPPSGGFLPIVNCLFLFFSKAGHEKAPRLTERLLFFFVHKRHERSATR